MNLIFKFTCKKNFRYLSDQIMDWQNFNKNKPFYYLNVYRKSNLLKSVILLIRMQYLTHMKPEK